MGLNKVYNAISDNYLIVDIHDVNCKHAEARAEEELGAYKECLENWSGDFDQFREKNLRSQFDLEEKYTITCNVGNLKDKLKFLVPIGVEIPPDLLSSPIWEDRNTDSAEKAIDFLKENISNFVTSFDPQYNRRVQFGAGEVDFFKSWLKRWGRSVE